MSQNSKPISTRLKRQVLGLSSLAASLLLLLNMPSLAASFTVSPVRLDLPADGRPAVLRVTNDDDLATLVQVTTVGWTDNLDGAQRTGDILAVPPVFELPPKGEQILRLALREPLQGSAERAYRLLITEVPRAIADDGVTFALRLDLPVFVAPQGAAPQPVWALRATHNGAAELVLRNEGQAHLRVSKLTLLEPGRAEPILTIDQAATALAGKELRWPLEQSAHSLPQVLEVRAETPGGELVMPLTNVRE